MLSDRVYAVVNDERATATMIYARLKGERKNLTPRMRRERRQVAEALEELHSDGRIYRGWSDRHLGVPVYWRDF